MPACGAARAGWVEINTTAATKTNRTTTIKNSFIFFDIIFLLFTYFPIFSFSFGPQMKVSKPYPILTILIFKITANYLQSSFKLAFLAPNGLFEL